MTSTLRICALIGATLAAGAAPALEKKVANNDVAAAGAYRTASRNDSAMQAMCREILVDTDEGYGVTNQESRVICDELR
jgi:hypothetical protein